MGRNAARWIVAIVALVLVGFMAMPGCRLTLCKGDGCGGGPDVGGWGGAGATGAAGGAAGAGGASTADDEDKAAAEAAAKADPQEVELRAVSAMYAASVTAALVETQVGAPATVDPDTLNQIIDENAAAGWDAASQWLSMVDVSTLPLNGVVPKFECEDEPYLCPYRTSCPYGDNQKSYCVVTQCGDCPWCPFPQNLVYKAACAYGCILSDGTVVGGAWILRTIFGNYTQPYCFEF